MLQGQKLADRLEPNAKSVGANRVSARPGNLGHWRNLPRLNSRQLAILRFLRLRGCASVAFRRTGPVTMNELPNQLSPPLWLRCLPGLTLFRTYRRAWLRADALAGVSVCVVMIPSVIAYAGLLGLPPQHGLYAALVPLLVYPFFGSSRQVIVDRKST